MLLKITERNAWENESWSYVIDISKQDAETINWLMIFVRCANEEYKKVSDAAPVQNFGGPFSRPYKVFAASRYNVDFWDGVADESEDGEMRLYRMVGKQRTHTTIRGGDYKSGGNFLDQKLSFAKVKSAAVTMRDKKENKLYKDLESAFIKRKHQPIYHQSKNK